MHWARRSGVNPVQFLENLVQYVQGNWEHNPIHPTHRDEVGKELLKLRRRLKKVKTDRKKQQIRDRIKDLQNARI